MSKVFQLTAPTEGITCHAWNFDMSSKFKYKYFMCIQRLQKLKNKL
jgi:hypothetical protein